jgi:Fe-S-cluster containining protein
MLMSQRDKWMFAKYYGRLDLIDDNLYWDDVLEVYRDTNVPLPMPVKPEAVRQFFDGFECARCGDCCKYPHTQLSQREIDRIAESSEENKWLIESVLEDYGGGKSIKAPCPFFKDNSCTIYKIRSHTCYFFPLQLHVGTEIEVNGEKQSVMFCRVKCPSSVKAIRTVIRDMLKQSDKFILLPNLNITSTNMIGG